MDFDGKRYLWVEFHSSTERSVCVENIPKISPNDKTFKYKLDNNIIGHISHAKLLKDNKIFIVHSLNKCEIRNLDDTFSLVESFKHIGEEVYGVDVFYTGNISENNFIKINQNLNNPRKLNKLKSELGTVGENEDDEKENNNGKKLIIQDDLNIEYPKVYKGNKNPEKKINDDKETNSVGYLDKNGIKYSNSINVQNLYIVTLDIDGNSNLK